MAGGGPFNLKPGEWTDDTSMALCLAESLIHCSEFDPEDQIQRYVKWMEEGYLSSNGTCFDIGNTVSTALRNFQRTGNPFSGSTDPNSAGNGSIMRLAPVPMYFASNPAKAIDLSGKSSRTTHGAEVCIDACRYMGALIVGALNGEEKEALLAPHFSPISQLWEEEPLCSDIAEIANGSFKEKEPPEIAGTGYVVKSLEAALWAFSASSSFEEGCLLAVNLGNDADTTGAVYGQIAGAFYGRRDIPDSWLNRLVMRERIQEVIGDLCIRSISRQQRD